MEGLGSSSSYAAAASPTAGWMMTTMEGTPMHGGGGRHHFQPPTHGGGSSSSSAISPAGAGIGGQLVLAGNGEQGQLLPKTLNEMEAELQKLQKQNWDQKMTIFYQKASAG